MSVKDIRHSSVAGDSQNGPPMEAAGFMAPSHPGQINAGCIPGLDCPTAHSAHTFADLKKSDHCFG